MDSMAGATGLKHSKVLNACRLIKSERLTRSARKGPPCAHDREWAHQELDASRANGRTTGILLELLNSLNSCILSATARSSSRLGHGPLKAGHGFESRSCRREKYLGNASVTLRDLLYLLGRANLGWSWCGGYLSAAGFDQSERAWTSGGTYVLTRQHTKKTKDTPRTIHLCQRRGVGSAITLGKRYWFPADCSMRKSSGPI